MSISGIQSNTFNPYQLGANAMQQQMQQLSQDLQSGNLSAAQSDFATLQQAFTQSAATSGTASNSTYAATTSPFEQAFSQVGSDLKSGNISAAQKDFNTVQQDLRGPGFRSTNLPHDKKGWNGGPAVGPSSPIQDLNRVGQGLASSNLTSAQQAYTTLEQQFQQSALAGGAINAESPDSFDV
ncbi:MAG: hypothetical protein WBQ43_01595 [Terriglobales bacterium]